MNRFFMGEVRSRVASTRNDKKRQIKMRGAGDAHAFAIVAYSTKTFKDEPSSPRTFRMSKEETLQRIKQVEAQIRTMKEEAEREREATLRNARREALELTEQVQEKAEARYREIVNAAEAEIESEREKLLAAAREDAARMVAQGKANVDRAVDLVVGKFRGAIRA